MTEFQQAYYARLLWLRKRKTVKRRGRKKCNNIETRKRRIKVDSKKMRGVKRRGESKENNKNTEKQQI